MGFNMAILFYLSVYGPCVLKRDLDLAVDMPQMVPFVTLAFMVIFISSIVALWPVWGFFTIIYLFILSFGTTFSLMFVPDGAIGTFIFWIGALAAGIVSHNLKHDPVW